MEFTKAVVNILKIVGTALAIINGFIQPISSLVYGELTDELMVSTNNMNASTTNNANNSVLKQNVTGNSRGLSFGSVLENNSGSHINGNNTDSQLLNNLKILQNSISNTAGNTSDSGVHTQLVLTPETNPFHPPGYGYPVMPGLIRIRPQLPQNSTKTKPFASPLPAEQEKKISKYALYYCYLALATFVCSYGQLLFWNIASSEFFQQKQDEYEKLEQDDLDNEQTEKRKHEKNEQEESDDRIGGRITILIQNVANFASSMIVSFVQNWQLTLMMLAAGPIMASVLFYMNKLKSFAMEKVKFLLQKAKGVAKGAFAQVQTVAAFGGQDFEKNKFATNLLAANKVAKIRSIVDAVRAGIMIVIAFIFLGIGFWFSAGLILDGTLTPGAFISIFMAIISSVLKLVNVGDAVRVDNDKDKKEEKSLFSSDPEEIMEKGLDRQLEAILPKLETMFAQLAMENQGPDIIGKILEQLSNPEEVFKHYPSRPEMILKSKKEEDFEDSTYVEFTNPGRSCDRSNMAENNIFAYSVYENEKEIPGRSTKPDIKSPNKKWKQFKEKMKSKVQSKNEMEEKNTGMSEQDLKNKFSFEKVKERLKTFSETSKSWLEDKVFSQVKKRGLSLEVVKLQIKQLPLIVLSLVGAVMTGMIAPGFSLLLSEILIVTADPKRLQAERLKWSFKFFDLGVFIAIGSTVQKFSTSLSESRVEMGMKENAFNSAMNESKAPKSSVAGFCTTSSPQSEDAFLTQKTEKIDITEAVSKEKDLDSEDEVRISKYNQEKTGGKDLNLLDGPNNSQAATMTEKMDTDAMGSLKNSFSLSHLTTKVSGSISTIMTLLISFTNGWKMTLVVLAGLPIIAYAQSVQNSEPEKEKVEEEYGMVSKLWRKFRGLTSGKVKASQCTSKYRESCLKSYRYIVRTLIATGLAFAIAECVTFLVYAGALRYGGYLVRVGDMTIESVMTVLMTVLFGGAGSSNTPAETSKPKHDSPEKVHHVDIKEKNNSVDEKPVKLDEVKGDVEFHDVEFHHPENKNVLMSGLNISVKSSETLAIVGTTDFNSNCITALLERFYDPVEGLITLDDVDIRSLDVKWFRSQIALVSQTGVLSHHSLADNLQIADSSRYLGKDFLENMSRLTHLHEVVHSLPKSYDSLIIDDVILSDITKQKLAITRALIRNPRILIINEFSQSEEEVEESLRNLCSGRTCIIFARYLSTVEKADKVAIVCHGRVVEQGSRNELMKTRGLLYHLLNMKLHSDIAPAL